MLTFEFDFIVPGSPKVEIFLDELSIIRFRSSVGVIFSALLALASNREKDDNCFVTPNDLHQFTDLTHRPDITKQINNKFIGLRNAIRNGPDGVDKYCVGGGNNGPWGVSERVNILLKPGENPTDLTTWLDCRRIEVIRTDKKSIKIIYKWCHAMAQSLICFHQAAKQEAYLTSIDAIDIGRKIDNSEFKRVSKYFTLRALSIMELPAEEKNAYLGEIKLNYEDVEWGSDEFGLVLQSCADACTATPLAILGESQQLSDVVDHVRNSIKKTSTTKDILARVGLESTLSVVLRRQEEYSEASELLISCLPRVFLRGDLTIIQSSLFNLGHCLALRDWREKK